MIEMKPQAPAASTALLLAFAIAAGAHSGAEGIVKERMEMMKDIAAHMKSVARMVRGNREFDADRVAEAASVIADHAAHIPEKFPQDSLGDPSEATAAIWDNWDEFTGLSEELEEKAEALLEASGNAADASSLGSEFRELGATCMSCHEDFRETG
jgi:cytochrome c556